jgi:hypothetical protein
MATAPATATHRLVCPILACVAGSGERQLRFGVVGDDGVDDVAVDPAVGLEVDAHPIGRRRGNRHGLFDTDADEPGMVIEAALPAAERQQVGILDKRLLQPLAEAVGIKARPPRLSSDEIFRMLIHMVSPIRREANSLSLKPCALLLVGMPNAACGGRRNIRSPTAATVSTSSATARQFDVDVLEHGRAERKLSARRRFKRRHSVPFCREYPLSSNDGQAPDFGAGPETIRGRTRSTSWLAVG